MADFLTDAEKSLVLLIDHILVTTISWWSGLTLRVVCSFGAESRQPVDDVASVDDNILQLHTGFVRP